MGLQKDYTAENIAHARRHLKGDDEGEFKNCEHSKTGRKLPPVQTNPLSFQMPVRQLAVRRTVCTNLTLAMRFAAVSSHPDVIVPDDTSTSTFKRRSIHSFKDMLSLGAGNEAGKLTVTSN